MLIVNLTALRTFMFASDNDKVITSTKKDNEYIKSNKMNNFGENEIIGSVPTYNKDDIYLQGDTDLLSKDAIGIVQELSDLIYKKTGIKVFLYVIRNTPQHDKEADNSTDINVKFQNRRFYEANVIRGIHSDYAIIFLFYNDHAITLKSNLDFLNDSHAAELLEEYAYPHLPADEVGTLRYESGVNEGVSNLYLALINKIAEQYNFKLNIPKPIEKQNDATKIVIYIMLFTLICLFVIVRFGLLSFNKKG